MTSRPRLSSSTTNAIIIPVNVDQRVLPVFQIILSEKINMVNGKAVNLIPFVAGKRRLGDENGPVVDLSIDDYLIDLKPLSLGQNIPTDHNNTRPTIYVRQRVMASNEPEVLITREEELCTGLWELSHTVDERYNGDLSGVTELVHDILKSYFKVLNKLKLDAAIQVYISQSGKGQEEFLHEALAAQTGVRFVHYKQSFKVNHVLNQSQLQAVLGDTSTEHTFNVIPICASSVWSTEAGSRDLLELLGTNKEKIVSRGILIVKDSSPINDPGAVSPLRDLFNRYSNRVVELQMQITSPGYDRRVVNQKIQIFIMHYKDRLDAFFINESETVGPAHITELLAIRDNFIEAEKTVSDIKSKYMSKALRDQNPNVSL